jgi:RNA polymerase sigma factor (sigma-70 family)
VTGDRQEAEEVLQDAFLALFEHWDRIQSIEDTVGYLYRRAFNRWRRLSRRAARQLRELARTVDRTDEFANVDNKDAIDRALHSLTPRQRAAIVLTEVLGFSSPEAARIMGVRDVSVRALASHGRGTLRRMLEAGDE